MKVLIAPDKFKGSLTAGEAAAAMAAGVARFNPDWEVVMLPIADGGEGTAEVMTRATGGSFVRTQAPDPLFRPVACQYGISGDGKTAFIDMAEASGLARLQPHERNPLRTTSIGTGQLILHAIGKKCNQIVLGLGGTSTIDCGTGIAYALGVSFLDEYRQVLSPIGANLGKVEYISKAKRHPSLERTNIILLADVSSPLLGDQGAMLYTAQKGLMESSMATMEANLEHFANLLEAEYGIVAKTPGLGAAGGAAMSCLSFLGAKLANGAEFLLDALKIPAAIADADLVITGEGQLDEQSLHGKAAIALARKAQLQGKPVVAVCGKIRLGLEEQIREGITLSGALVPDSDGQIPADSATELTTRTMELLRELAPKLG